MTPLRAAHEHAPPSAHTICPPLLHAGEINTLQGNLNWVASREHELKHPIWQGREEALTPLCDAANSDRWGCSQLGEHRCMCTSINHFLFTF